MRRSIPLALLLAAITTSPSDAVSEGQTPPHSATLREDEVLSVLTPEMLAMPRERMLFEDPRAILFNRRGFVHLKESSRTLWLSCGGLNCR